MQRPRCPVVLLALNTIIGGRWVRDRGDLLRLAVLGMLGIAANQTLFLYGLKHTTASNPAGGGG